MVSDLAKTLAAAVALVLLSKWPGETMLALQLLLVVSIPLWADRP